MKKILTFGLLCVTFFLASCENKQDKTDGLQKVAIVQAMKTIALFKTQLATYYTEHEACNSESISRNDQALTKIHFVQEVVSNNKCQIILTFKDDKTIPDLANTQIILTLQPTQSTHNWRCEFTTAKRDLIPENCI